MDPIGLFFSRDYARAAYANSYEQRANYERELTRELRDVPLCEKTRGVCTLHKSKFISKEQRSVIETH